MSSNGTVWDISGARTMGTAVYNEWVHYAITRKDGTFYVFQNGILKDSLYSSAPIFNSVADFLIGSFASPIQLFKGYIDEFRISKGIARWSENFDPTNTEDGKLLLTITLAEEVEREYPVTKNELDTFIKWYDSRANGTGSAYYTFDKFLNRKDYIVYDKILTFEVTDFSK